MVRPFALALMGCVLIVCGGCAESVSSESDEANKPAGQDGWLHGDVQNKFETVAAHLRGMDMAMVEVGYRYGELHWAGEDKNWDYARYQAEKIELAMQRGLERRPQRAKSAEPFMEEDLPALLAAIASHDAGRYRAAMERLRVGCMKCHVEEDVPYFTVYPPEHRHSPIRNVP